MTIKYQLHPFYSFGPDYPPLLAIVAGDGINYIIEEGDVDLLIDLLQRYKRGEHDGVIDDDDPRARAEGPILEFTPVEIAEMYGIEPGTVRRSVKMGWIPARKSGKAVLIRKEDAEKRWGKKKPQDGS